MKNRQTSVDSLFGHEPARIAMDQYPSLTNNGKEYGSVMHLACLNCWTSNFIEKMKRKDGDGEEKR